MMVRNNPRRLVNSGASPPCTNSKRMIFKTLELFTGVTQALFGPRARVFKDDYHDSALLFTQH